MNDLEKKYHARRETNLLNGICPNDRRHKDISTLIRPSGYFSLTCHNCKNLEATSSLYSGLRNTHVIKNIKN